MPPTATSALDDGPSRSFPPDARAFCCMFIIPALSLPACSLKCLEFACLGENKIYKHNKFLPLWYLQVQHSATWLGHSACTCTFFTVSHFHCVSWNVQSQNYFATVFNFSWGINQHSAKSLLLRDQLSCELNFQNMGTYMLFHWQTSVHFCHSLFFLFQQKTTLQTALTVILLVVD